MKNENEKEQVIIPGALSYIITKKSRFDSAFLDFQWLLKARSRDITRPNITGISIEPTQIIATDGARLHIITNPYPSISPGCYDVYTINQSKIIIIAKPNNNATKFPDWNRPIITMGGETPIHLTIIDHSKYFYTEILKHRPVQISYLTDAISPDEEMTVKIYSSTQPIIITTSTRTAIIMPMKEMEGKVS